MNKILTTDIKTHLLASGIRRLYEITGFNTFFSAGVVAISILLTWPDAHKERILPLLIVVFASGYFRYFHICQFLKKERTDESVIVWGKIYTLMLGLFGLVTFSGYFLIVPYGNHLYDAIFFIYTIGLSSGAIAQNSWYLPASRVFMWCTVLPMSVIYFSNGDRLSYAMGTAGTIFLILMTVVSKKVNQIYMNNIESNKSLAVEVETRKKSEDKILQLNKELQVAKEQAEAASHAKTIFLASMSHELRTPLNVILGFSKMISKDQNISPKHSEHLNLIRRSGEILLAQINQILDLSKIESGQISLNEDIVDFYPLLDELKEMFNPLAKEKGLNLVFDCSSDVPRTFVTDEMKLYQVLINLIGNSIKFTEKGSVSLQVGVKPTDTDSFTPKLLLQFAVKDTGLGIRPDEIDKVFKAFTQTESGKKSQQGTGLGLSISQKFVKLMGDNITISSKPGSGSTFSFGLCVLKVDPSEVIEKKPYLRSKLLKTPRISPKLDLAAFKSSIATLPPQLVSELKEAATYCEVETLNQIITEVSRRNLDLAEELDRLSMEYDFDGILALLEEKI